ncbi:hypothetical protein JJQ72_01285 [Paenibacillus sp. F411]|uniref:hypothetical protein n=1 Tax=Paenibacillus sp. F411 TaxID=2820239 RepID=UPI001AAE6C73|nr:hypothetical protein [Paenibacillus sp. F411]MBO2942617.1 hypothetical protein [Paenibacillus sp. F411]
MPILSFLLQSSVIRAICALLSLSLCAAPAGHAKEAPAVIKPGLQPCARTQVLSPKRLSTFINQAALSLGVPSAVESFARESIEQLSQHPPFTGWTEASADYVPLGPGTHSWLVMLQEAQVPIGYLIITADEEGGYMLSEYGIGSDLPYSLNQLEDALTALGLSLPMDPRMNQGTSLTVETFYDPSSPFWRISSAGSPSLYIHGITGDLLPNTAFTSKALTGVTNEDGHISIAAGLVSSASSWAPAAAALGKGSPDPYSNLLWKLGTPRRIVTAESLQPLLIAQSRSAVIFDAGKLNPLLAGPLSLTGSQLWSRDNQVMMYIAASHHGIRLQRYLPSEILIGHGQFYVQAQGTVPSLSLGSP